MLVLFTLSFTNWILGSERHLGNGPLGYGCLASVLSCLLYLGMFMLLQSQTAGAQSWGVHSQHLARGLALSRPSVRVCGVNYWAIEWIHMFGSWTRHMKHPRVPEPHRCLLWLTWLHSGLWSPPCAVVAETRSFLFSLPSPLVRISDTGDNSPLPRAPGIGALMGRAQPKCQRGEWITSFSTGVGMDYKSGSFWGCVFSFRPVS